jgi:hypothetical protein
MGILNRPSAPAALLRRRQSRVTKIVSKPSAERDAESASQPGFAAGFSAPTRPMDASGLTARCTARCSREKTRALRRSALEQRRRRRPRPKCRRRRRLLAPLTSVSEYPLNELRLLSARDHSQLSATARALLDLNPEHPFQAPRGSVASADTQAREMRVRPDVSSCESQRRLLLEGSSAESTMGSIHLNCLFRMRWRAQSRRS